MTTRPGVFVTTSATLATATTPSQRLSRAMVAAQTQRGPAVPDPLTPITSLAAYETVYGTRDTTLGLCSTSYDWIEAFFRSGGTSCLVSRVVGPDAVVASLTLDDRHATTPDETLRVDAVGPGEWYTDHVKVAVANGTESGTFVLTVLVDDQAVEVSPDLASPADAVAWSEASSRIRCVDLSSTTAAPLNIPAVSAAAALAGGDDDIADVTDAQWTAALTAIEASWGPGLVAKLGVTSSAGHAGTMAHAAACNRFALLDGPVGATQGTLTTLAGTVASAATAPEYGMLVAPAIVAPPANGLTAPRIIGASAFAAGVISKQVATGNTRQAAAGLRGAIPWARGVQKVFTDAERELLAGTRAVNPIRYPYSAAAAPVPELYSYWTLGAASGGWRDAGDQLLRTLLIDELTLVGEQFVFAQIDGKGQLVAQFGEAVTAILHDHFDRGELYELGGDPAYVVDTTSPNTPATLAAGELWADVSARFSATGHRVHITVAKAAVDQALAAA